LFTGFELIQKKPFVLLYNTSGYDTISIEDVPKGQKKAAEGS